MLPAIQQEFVWSRDKINRLFDSLMRGYPIGSFLMWQVQEGNAGRFTFYDFMRDYHERDNAHCAPTGPLGSRAVTAILDGQQRLTALNIGLYGSFTAKLPRLWANNPLAYPKKYRLRSPESAGQRRPTSSSHSCMAPRPRSLSPDALSSAEGRRYSG
ncbi:hypothetical protein SY2F82_41520 [Streptomyces sp. Y2F8-2]|nr:hypothetical protein SY2F82_41520 [Streptomyces sp. Y2F8-2]